MRERGRGRGRAGTGCGAVAIFYDDEKQAMVQEGLMQSLGRSGVMMMMRVVAGNCGLPRPDSHTHDTGCIHCQHSHHIKKITIILLYG